MKGPVQLGVNAHVMNLMPPTVAANQYSDYFTLENAAHVDVIIQTGVVTSACTITVYESTTNGGTVKSAIAFDYYYTSTTTSDIISARTAATAGGISTGTTDALTWVISIDASQLTDTYDWVAVHISTASTYISMAAVLTGMRYGAETPLTAQS